MRRSKLELTFKIVTELGKAVWNSTLNILYLIVYSYALFIAIFYYSGEVSGAFMQLIVFLTNNWGYFWILFFASRLYNAFKWDFRRRSWKE